MFELGLRLKVGSENIRKNIISILGIIENVLKVPRHKQILFAQNCTYPFV